MEDLVVRLDNNALKTSIKKVMKSVSTDLVDLRNKTPKIVAKKLFALTQAMVPVYTETLKLSGRLETEKGEGASIIYDATKGEQVEAQKQKFKKVYFPLNEGDDPNESYADDVDANTEFMTAAVELYAHGTAPTLVLKESGKKIYLDMDLEIPKRGGYITREDFITAKRRTKARRTLSRNISKLSGYDVDPTEQKAYVNRLKKRYKKRFGVDYKE